MAWKKIELNTLFNLLITKTKEWGPVNVIPNLLKTSELILPQLEQYKEGKYRSDRNEVTGF
ncbi:MAG: hypothetical protein ACXAD7_28205, partial [Candidatus Kariarchaeaceae archaeon]